MLDIKIIREKPDVVKTALKNRNILKSTSDALVMLDQQWRQKNAQAEELKSARNKASDEMAGLVQQKIDISEKRVALKELSQKIKDLDEEVGEIKEKIDKIVINIPNIPHNSIPVGAPSQNKIVREYPVNRDINFTPKNHIELSEYLDIIDFPRATKITGSNFVLFKGAGAYLERALISFMLGLHTKKHGFLEFSPPFVVNRASMIGTGQLPKMEEDMYRTSEDDFFLIPTAEVPVTNIHRDEILDGSTLPLYYTAYTPCFRREAGSYGKDTRGLLRVHQFDKVELVKFVKPDGSYAELESLLNCAEKVLQLLELPYRVLCLATGDLSCRPNADIGLLRRVI